MPFSTRLDRYIFRLVAVPLIGVFVLAASLLILDQMLRLFRFVTTEGGPMGVVFQMLGTLLPDYASLAIPLGLLLGTLFAFRQLSLSSELDVMRAVGLSYTRLLRVPYAITIVLMAVNASLVFYIQPISKYYYEELQFDLRSGALGASIKVGEFNTLADRMALRVEASEDSGRKLQGIFARIVTEDGQTLSISAREGRFLSTSDNPDTIILRLSDGTIVQDPKAESPRVLNFSLYDLPIDLPAIQSFRQRGEGEAEYILPELLRIGWSDSSSETQRDASQASLNYRMVELAMMLFMPLLAVALAIPPKRSTSALGVFVAVVLVVAYHKVNQYMQDLASLGRIDPVLGLWGPFAAFVLLILWWFWQIAYVPGGQPIGALENAFAKIVKRLGKIVRPRRRADSFAAEQAS
ncbi:MAG: LptF/LptG family permease [Erythrobacter sp.]|nr:LptF/LptG family permease [Erythrobacter sp.]NCQ64820.1 LptF/LptG family permease [Alphaproteobacteria bacterium]